ncbi:hypothetical protein [Clostridium sp.]|uniref:hypothetical protein n=1 Tax=Clostridium sp. TaxID=1506 RepID=UPI001A464015|nr:hypothetical protein [Clostridium sp.]MBK5243186.1 hypothetical protein [Clostridium sp.]
MKQIKNVQSISFGIRENYIEPEHTFEIKSKFTEVTKEQYTEYLENLPNGYVYSPNTMVSRTDIRDVTELGIIMAYRHIKECEGDIDRYYIS